MPPEVKQCLNLLREKNFNVIGMFGTEFEELGTGFDYIYVIYDPFPGISLADLADIKYEIQSIFNKTSVHSATVLTDQQFYKEYGNDRLDEINKNLITVESQLTTKNAPSSPVKYFR